MIFALSRPVLLALAMTTLATHNASADCESDMLQLEDAMKAPNLTPQVKAAYDNGGAKAASAMRKDDDETCHKAIADALAMSGKVLK